MLELSRWSRLAAVLLTLTLFVAACGGGSSPNDNEGEDASSAPDADGESEDGEEASGEPLKVGMSMPLTGPIASFGHIMQAGAKAALEEVNEDGGVDGRELQLVILDDQGDPARASTNVRELLEQGIELMIGPTMSTAQLAGLPILTEAEMVSIVPGSATEATNIERYPYSFRVHYTSDQEAQLLVAHAVEELKATKVGFLGDNLATGLAGAAATAKELAKHSLRLTGTEFHNPGDTDMTAQLRRLEAAGTEVLVTWSLSQETASILRGLQQIGWEPVVISQTGATLKGAVDLAGPLMEPLIAIGYKALSWPAGSSPDDLPEESVTFAERIKAELEVDAIPEALYNAVAHYHAVKAVKWVVEEAGGDTSAEALAKVFENTDSVNLGLGEFGWSRANHNGFKLDSMALVQPITWHDGMFEQAPTS